MDKSVQSWRRRVVSAIGLITLSARASTFGGILRPICLAVLRLMISSNFVGCSTGKSAGLVPFEDFVHVRGDAPIQVNIARGVGHKATKFRILCRIKYRWKLALY